MVERIAEQRGGRGEGFDELIKGAALDIPFAPLISLQSLLPRFARLARYAEPQRARNSRLGPHNGLSVSVYQIVTMP